MGIECARGWNNTCILNINSAKLKQYYYFHAEFLEEIWYNIYTLLATLYRHYNTVAQEGTELMYGCAVRMYTTHFQGCTVDTA